MVKVLKERFKNLDYYDIAQKNIMWKADFYKESNKFDYIITIMSYNSQDIGKIVGFTTWTVKRKVDELLRIDSEMYTTMGSDSKESEIKKTKATSRKIYQAISRISPTDGYFLQAHMDEKELLIQNQANEIFSFLVIVGNDDRPSQHNMR